MLEFNAGNILERWDEKKCFWFFGVFWRFRHQLQNSPLKPKFGTTVLKNGRIRHQSATSDHNVFGACKGVSQVSNDSYNMCGSFEFVTQLPKSPKKGCQKPQLTPPLTNLSMGHCIWQKLLRLFLYFSIKELKSAKKCVSRPKKLTKILWIFLYSRRCCLHYIR